MHQETAATDSDSECDLESFTGGDVPSQRDTVVCTELDNGEIVLLDLDSKSYYSANETGQTVWRLIDGRRTIADIVSAVAKAYEGELEQIQDSVTQFLQDLLAQDLVAVQGAQQEEESA